MDQRDGPPGLLLLSCDERWRAAVRGEAAGLAGVRPVVVAEARQAIELLAGGEHFSHLLMHPPAAGGLLADLIGLTVGEAESGIAVVLLGEGAEAARRLPGGGRASVVAQPYPGWLGPALAGPAAEPAPAEAAPPLDELLATLAAGRLQTRYQPVVWMADGVPLGLEVLARLEHPTLGTLPPDRFVRRLKAAGFAFGLAEVVVRRAFADWRGEALPGLGVRLAINLPLDVLLRPDAIEWLEARREAATIAAGRIVVELTEPHPMPRPDRLRPVLDRLHGAGYRLSIDDFGADLCDDQALFDLPFNSLKLDKDLVQASSSSAAALGFVGHVTRAAQAAGRLVIAEGIESGPTGRGWRASASMRPRGS